MRVCALTLIESNSSVQCRNDWSFVRVNRCGSLPQSPTEPVRLSWGQRRGIAGEPVGLSWGQRRKEDLPESQCAYIGDKEDLPEGRAAPPRILALVMGNVAISSYLARRLPAKPYYHPLIRG